MDIWRDHLNNENYLFGSWSSWFGIRGRVQVQNLRCGRYLFACGGVATSKRAGGRDKGVHEVGAPVVARLDLERLSVRVWRPPLYWSPLLRTGTV